MKGLVFWFILLYQLEATAQSPGLTITITMGMDMECGWSLEQSAKDPADLLPEKFQS